SIPGVGSSFSVSFRLPIERPASPTQDLVGMRVAVIDDHPGARAATVAVLVAAGAGATPCTGFADLERLLDGSGGVDVIVLDGDLGGGTADVLAGIADLRRHRNRVPPVVLCP